MESRETATKDTTPIVSFVSNVAKIGGERKKHIPLPIPDTVYT